MTILVLMAGSGDAFKEAAYPYPKNLVEVNGLPVVQRVMESLEPLFALASRVVFMIPDEEVRQYHTDEVIRLLMPSATVLPITLPTAGAACTALLAVEALEPDEPLLIVNGDQIVAADLAQPVSDFLESGWDGGIVVFEAVHPRWSFVRCDADGMVVEAAEKRPISNRATAGVYYFARARDFIEGAMNMIKKDSHVGGAFYICPVYNEMILNQARIGTRQIGRETYFSLANPQGVEDYEDYLQRGGNKAGTGSAPRRREETAVAAR